MDQPGKVANPARGQLNRENNIPLSPCVPENLVSRDGFSRPVPRQPAHLHTQAESGIMYVCMVITYSRVWINRVRLPILLVVSYTCLRIWSRETGSAVPSRVSLLISILRLNLVLTYGIPPEFRGRRRPFMKPP